MPAPKVIAITGASKGIGLEMVRQFAARGDKVYALVRKRSPELLAGVGAGVTVVEGIDVTDTDVGTKLQEAFTGVTIDCLVNNAGAYGSTVDGGVMELFAAQSLEKVSAEDMRRAFDLNTIAPLQVSRALLPQISTVGGKIIIITSLMGSIGDNTSGGSYAYRAAKAAVNMVGKSLAMDLKAKGVAVSVVHPGMVRTSFAGDAASIPEQMRKAMHDVQPSVRGVIQAIDATTLETTGSFYHGNYGEGIKTCPW